MNLNDEQRLEFGERGLLVLRQVVPNDACDAANSFIDDLIEAELPTDHVGPYSFWLETGDAPELMALFSETGVHRYVRSLVGPSQIEVAFDQVQVALNVPHFSHRPGGHHLDGYVEGQTEPGTFSVLVGILLSEQSRQNSGNVWVWPGTHRVHAAYFRERGPDALVADRGYPQIELPEPEQVVGGVGDVLLAHHMLGHNHGGNYESATVRRAVYFRVREEQHAARWRQSLQDELLDFPAVREAFVRARSTVDDGGK